jgi:Zn-dependent peptidase ImmA (M78 family)
METNMENYIEVKPEVLESTRKSLGIDLPNASKLSGIPINRIKQLESDKKPNLLELKALAKAYNSSIAALLLYKPQSEKPLPKDRRTVNSEQEGIFDSKTILAVRKARALLGSLIELKNELGIPISEFSYKATLNTDPKELAIELRKEWNLDEIKALKSVNLALEAFIEKIESLGVAIFQLPLTKDNLRGFSIIDEQLPIIVIKRGGEPSTAKIFTLFHELGHILINEGGICDIKLHMERQKIEKWCNAFAGELLVPSKELLGHSIVKNYFSSGEREWVKMDLIKIGNDFFVGPLVILRRLLENNRTTKEFYDQKHDVWNKPTFSRAKEPEGRNIPKEIIREKGKTYIGLALNAFDRNKINLKDLSDYLGIKFSYIPRIRQLLYE